MLIIKKRIQNKNHYKVYYYNLRLILDKLKDKKTLMVEEI